VTDKTISYRVVIILAVSSDAEVYSTLSMENSTGETFRLFLSELCKALYAKDKDFRDSNFFWVDGATWHRDSKIRDFVTENG